MITGKLDKRKRRLNVEVKSEITGTVTQVLRDGMAKLRRAHAPDEWDAVYFDMRNARIIDSMGLNWVFGESRWLKELDKTMVIRIASPAIHKVMDFSRMEKVATIKFRRRRQLR
jgi:anti-anti-sigma regulatory factor